MICIRLDNKIKKLSFNFDTLFVGNVLLLFVKSEIWEATLHQKKIYPQTRNFFNNNTFSMGKIVLDFLFTSEIIYYEFLFYEWYRASQWYCYIYIAWSRFHHVFMKDLIFQT